MITLTIAFMCTVALTGYAMNRGRSPLWGVASLMITGLAILLARAIVQSMGATDLVFSEHGSAVAMFAALVEPVVAVVGNLLLYSRLATLPSLRSSAGSTWIMWKVGDDDEGYKCLVSASAEAIVGTRGTEVLFSIPRAQLAAVDVDGETLLLRCIDGRQHRLILASDDEDDRSARIAEIARIKRTIEQDVTRPA